MKMLDEILQFNEQFVAEKNMKNLLPQNSRTKKWSF